MRTCFPTPQHFPTALNCHNDFHHLFIHIKRHDTSIPGDTQSPFSFAIRQDSRIKGTVKAFSCLFCSCNGKKTNNLSLPTPPPTWTPEPILWQKFMSTWPFTATGAATFTPATLPQWCSILQSVKNCTLEDWCINSSHDSLQRFSLGSVSS